MKSHILLVQLALNGDERAKQALYPMLGGACDNLVWLGGYLRGLKAGQQQVDHVADVLRALLPYARSRAEDMHEEVESGAHGFESRTLWQKADAAVVAGEAVLAEEVADALGHS